jgi:hypothetical protein
LYGVIHAQPSITKGVLITNGSFSKDCREFVNGKRIELFDVNVVCGLLEKYDVSFFENTQKWAATSSNTLQKTYIQTLRASFAPRTLCEIAPP